jgi:putative hydrolase of the HAD superfamily
VAVREAARLPEAVLLDLDDTILDDSGCVESCWTDACLEASRRLPVLDSVLLRAEISDYAASWWSDPSRHRRGRLDLRAATSDIVGEAFRRLGHHDKGLAAEIANLYRDLREERARLHDGALEAIGWLRSQEVRLGLMTNGAGPAQRAKLERFGLAKYFDAIVIEGEFGCGKPDSRVFESLLTDLRTAPEKTWAVGDNLEFDVLAPMQMGIFGVWVNPAGSDAPEGKEPSRVIGALQELME